MALRSMSLLCQTKVRSHPDYVEVESFLAGLEGYSPSRHLTLSASRDVSPDRPTIGLNGHIDVEPANPSEWHHPSAVGGERRGGRVYGRGAADMLSGVAGMLFALQQIIEAGLEPATGVMFHSVADEEIGGNGTLRALLGSTMQPDYVLIAEPTNLTVSQSTLGFFPFAFKCFGRAVHMSAGSNTQGAVDVAVELYQQLQPLRQELRQAIQRSPEYSHISLNPLTFGRIAGGEDPAVPASSVLLEVSPSARRENAGRMSPGESHQLSTRLKGTWQLN